MLLNDFFSIKERKVDGQDAIYRLSLNADHPIYHAHFQGNPITPGACIVQMAKELAEDFYATSFFIRQIKNVKFLSIINPLIHTEIEVRFSGKASSTAVDAAASQPLNPVQNEQQTDHETNAQNMVTISALVCNAESVYCKMNLVLERINRSKIPELQSRMEQLQLCVIIPTYNNANTLADVLNDVLRYTRSIIVVNDGATDSTGELLKKYTGQIEIVSYSKNKGKGHALKCGFLRAAALGYKGAITLDSDSQHFASDIETFVRLAETCPGAMFVGQRMIAGRMPSKNSVANKLSNLIFTIQTGRRLQDTQNGFRLYPLARMKGMVPFTSRYEAEMELLVRAAWKGISILPAPVHVYYAPVGERISHFRPGMDFFRISLLNTCFVILAIIYGYPSMLFYKLFNKS